MNALYYLLIILAGALMAAIIIRVGERFVKEVSEFIEDVKSDKEKAD